MSPGKTDECNEHMGPSANPEQPVFRIPKCWEEHDPPPGYFDPVDPCSDPPSLVLDHRGLWDYAKSVRKQISDLTYEEVSPFLRERQDEAQVPKDSTGEQHR